MKKKTIKTARKKKLWKSKISFQRNNFQLTFGCVEIRHFIWRWKRCQQLWQRHTHWSENHWVLVIFSTSVNSNTACVESSVRPTEKKRRNGTLYDGDYRANAHTNSSIEQWQRVLLLRAVLLQKVQHERKTNRPEYAHTDNCSAYQRHRAASETNRCVVAVVIVLVAKCGFEVGDVSSWVWRRILLRKCSAVLNWLDRARDRCHYETAIAYSSAKMHRCH